jgi:hypothetical protein
MHLNRGKRAALADVMTEEEHEQVERQTLLRAIAIVQRYQDENWRRLRVNDICFDIKRLIREELRDEPAVAEARQKAS